MLNSRKQLFWKQINNAKDAEQYEKWINKENPVLPRKFRIAEIRGEPEEQTKVWAHMVVESVKGGIQLLRMRSSDVQNKVIHIDEQMEDEIRNKASGRILEIMLSLWKTDCNCN
jgi:hypothetical protein